MVRTKQVHSADDQQIAVQNLLCSAGRRAQFDWIKDNKLVCHGQHCGKWGDTLEKGGETTIGSLGCGLYIERFYKSAAPSSSLGSGAG